jgi:hypothetical protein
VELLDLGGGRNIRRIWQVYAPQAHGLVFVMDAADTERLGEAAEALQQALQDPAMQNKPLLVLANKKDVEAAAAGTRRAASAATEVLMSAPGTGSWHFAACSAAPAAPGASPTTDSIHRALRWLVHDVLDDWQALGPRVKREAAAARAAEQQRKRERDNRALAAKEERAR